MADTPDETTAATPFLPPSIDPAPLLAGQSYSHYSPLPASLISSPSTPCVLGIDEAGRGPVLGPMVYGLLYLPATLHHSLLARTHRFDDSKVLTPAFRAELFKKLCTADATPHETSADAIPSLHASCGWAVKLLSARDISASMLRPTATYNLNAQAMDATIELMKEVLARGVNVTEIYIDTIGPPASYQAKLARIFPTVSITVAKKADSLYPCVSAASVCAKVTRDLALELCAERYGVDGAEADEKGWGSGYPSDARCSSWLRDNRDPVFGWGNECRFSWSTAKDLLEGTGGLKVEWPAAEDEENGRLTSYFAAQADGGGEEGEGSDLAAWYGGRVAAEAF